MMFQPIAKYEAVGTAMMHSSFYLKFQHGRVFVAQGRSLYQVDNGWEHKCDLPFEFEFTFVEGRLMYLRECKTQNASGIYDIQANSYVTKEEIKDYEFYAGNDQYLFAINTKKSTNALFRSDNLSLMWEKPGFHYFQSDDSRHLFSSSNSDFSSFNPVTGDLQWRFDALANYNWTFLDEARVAEIRRLIGVHNGIIWLTLNSGRMLGLMESTGKVRFNITEPNYYPVGYVQQAEVAHFLGLQTHLDRETGMLFGIGSYHYWEIDLSRPDESFILYDTTESSKAHNIMVNPGAMGSAPWARNEIYFGDIDGTRNQIGVLDRNKKEVVWASKLNPDEKLYPAVKKIIYMQNKLFVLDGKQTLHVLKRESE